MATSDLREKLVQRMGAVFNEATTMMLNELREAAPLGETGETRRGLAVVPGGSLTNPTAMIVSTGKGGDYVESGHGEIFPKKPGGVLVFQAGTGAVSTPQVRGPRQGRNPGLVFTRHVRAVAARPWFRPITERWSEFLERASASIG